MRSMVEGRRRTPHPSVTARSRAAPPPRSLREQGGDDRQRLEAVGALAGCVAFHSMAMRMRFSTDG